MSNIAWLVEERLEAYAILAEAGITGLEIAPGIFFHADDDPFVPDARFDTYRREFGEKFEAIEIDPKDARPGGLKHPHSVLTLNLAEDGPTKAAEARVLAFFRERTGAADALRWTSAGGEPRSPPFS